MIEIVTARAIGASHKQSGTPCQDATAYDTTNRAAVLSVSDGLGSCELSHEGSRIATQTAVRVGLQLADEPGADALDCWRQAIEAARKAVLARAVDLAAKPMDLATTLSLTVITPSSVVVGGIGDGVHLLRDRKGALSLAGMGPASEFANHTHTLLDSSFRERAYFTERKREEVDGLVLSSDGLDRLLLRGPIDDPFPFCGLAHGLLDAGRTSRWQQLDYEQLAISLTESGQTDDDVSFAVARLTAPESGLMTNMISGKGLQVSRKARGPLRGGWTVSGAPGLALLPLRRPARLVSIIDALLSRPDVQDRMSPSPKLAWPMDAAVDYRGAVFALLVRPAIGTSLDQVAVESHARASALAEGAREAVAALHGLGYADGYLRMSDFIVGARGEVQLADLRRALTSSVRNSRRQARDRRFLRKLRPALCRRACRPPAEMPEEVS